MFISVQSMWPPPRYILIFLWFYFILEMECCACMCVYAPCMYLAEGFRSPEAGVTGDVTYHVDAGH